MKLPLAIIACALLSSCATQSPFLTRDPSSVDNCSEIAASLVLNPKDYILEKFRSYLKEQKYVDLSSESKFKQTLTPEERKVMAEFQYEAQFAKKMEEILRKAKMFSR